MKPFELMALHDALRLGASNTLSQFRKLETEVDGPMATLFARHAAAKNDGPALDALATDFEQLGFVLYAAEAAAEASRAHARSGASVLAVRAAERSEDLRARCEGASTPALMAPNPGVRLTAREREIALMASRGVSSRDIAAALQLSVRTVDNNLGRVYTKLGVSSRTALSELFESTGKTE
jgi:DNA-binding CsgD family transcriptional regulator